MGLFSKKEEAKNDAPPVPPVQTPGVPPAPGASVPAPAQTVEIPKPSEESGNLSSPPIPGGSLDDIKQQVSAGNNVPAFITEDEEVESVTDAAPFAGVSAEENAASDDDSLFDFSELDVNAPVNSDVEPVSMGNSEETLTHHEDVDVSFIKHNHKPTNDTYYLTTVQFKSLLEVIETVKNKVKDASEVHLKLLDIKAEEDIEFENLRKDFQFIEDKLYEVDSIIFEK